MYAYKHIERVLRTFPGVFTGIGEFSIHKEFVSAKVAGEVASLTNPALDSILDFAAKVGLIVILHNDMDMPMAKQKTEPVYLNEMRDLLRRHQKATIIWAHIGLGRIVHPAGSGYDNSTDRPPNHTEIVRSILEDPSYSNVYFDISWDEVAKYIVSSPEVIQKCAELMNKYPDRFLFGTDVVAPPDQKFYMTVYEKYEPLWNALKPETSDKIRNQNYIRLFDDARKKVRSWEAANVKQ
jgi:predicted TIM-barrel fold metal-dependent hydrolase